jgi:hypothetical protein
MPQARAVEQTLDETRLAQVAVVRLELEAAVVARQPDEAAVAQDIGHAEIDEDGIIIELAAGGGADIARIRAGMGGDFLLLIDKRCAEAKFRDGGPATVRAAAREGESEESWQDNEDK